MGPTSKGKGWGNAPNFVSRFGGIEAPVYLNLLTELNCNIIYDVIIKLVFTFSNVIAREEETQTFAPGGKHPHTTTAHSSHCESI